MRFSPKSDREYLVLKDPYHEIRSLRCAFCEFVQPMIRRLGDKSGQGRYNRARGKMIRHLYAEHRDRMKAAA